jgi:acetyl esterase
MTGEELDPQIVQFRRQAAQATIGLPPLAALSPPEARRLAEQARAPWRIGGPVMRRSEDRVMDDAAPPLRLRIYVPENAGAATLVYVHGGGWTMFSIETHDRLMREYAARAGMVVVGVDYALAPEAAFPVAIGQITHAIRRLHDAPAQFGLGGGPIFIGGDSAGANLSVATALTLRDAGEAGLIGGLILNYGVYDCACNGRSFDLYSDPAYMLTREEMLFFWSRYLPETRARSHPLASPLRAELRGLPPAFLAIAECDVLADENRAMAARLAAAGVPTLSVTYPGTTHSFLEAISIAPVAARALQDQAEWMRGLAAGR